MATIADILGLDPDEYRHVYKRIAGTRRVYSHLKRNPPPKHPHKAYKRLLAALDAVETDLLGVAEYEFMRAFARRHAMPARRGKPRDFHFYWIAKQLELTYKECTGRNPAVTWNAFDNRYEGKFLELVTLVMRKVDPHVIPGLGKAIQRLLKKPDIWGAGAYERMRKSSM